MALRQTARSTLPDVQGLIAIGIETKRASLARRPLVNLLSVGLVAAAVSAAIAVSAATAAAAAIATATAAATASAAATVTATATTTATIAAATAALRTVFTRARFVDLDGAAVHVLAMEFADGCVGFLIGGESDETESAGAAGLTVDGNHDVGHGATLTEGVAERVFGGAEGEIPHIEFVTHTIIFLLCLSARLQAVRCLRKLPRT